MQKQELEAKVKDLEGQLAELKQQRNPKGPSVVVVPDRKRAGKVREIPQDERDQLVDTIEAIGDAADEGRIDRVQKLVDEILDQYETVDDDEEEEEED